MDDPGDVEFDPLADSEERRVLFAALDSFRQYRQAAHYNITHLRRQSFYSLPSKQVDVLSESPFSLPATFNAVDDAIDSNADLSEAILQFGFQFCGLDADDESWKGQATPSDMDKARSTIKQFYRDWSAEGLAERQAGYSPICAALEAHLPAARPTERSGYRVLVPGAGLGRLVVELCAKGYCVEGNEISYHQLLASHYILNFAERPGQYKLFPWALGFSNHRTRKNQLRSVAVPDVHPATELATRSAQHGIEMDFSERMSMSAGDFCVVYRHPDQAQCFDAVTTCFFLDTAPNVISYIETIQHCLRPGGVWINLGPLLWHFESAPTPAEKEKQRKKKISADMHLVHDQSGNEGIGEPGSFELTNDEVLALVSQCGFEIQEHREASGTTGYILDPESMLQNVYRPSFWVAKRV